jgi:hypothetical protein
VRGTFEPRAVDVVGAPQPWTMATLVLRCSKPVCAQLPGNPNSGALVRYNAPVAQPWFVQFVRGALLAGHVTVLAHRQAILVVQHLSVQAFQRRVLVQLVRQQYTSQVDLVRVARRSMPPLSVGDRRHPRAVGKSVTIPQWVGGNKCVVPRVRSPLRAGRGQSKVHAFIPKSPLPVYYPSHDPSKGLMWVLNSATDVQADPPTGDALEAALSQEPMSVAHAVQHVAQSANDATKQVVNVCIAVAQQAGHAARQIMRTMRGLFARK